MNNSFRTLPKGLSTIPVHGGHNRNEWNHMPIVAPITTAACFLFQNQDPSQEQPLTYSRSNNPTRLILEKSLSTLENCKYGLAYLSGMGATSTVTQLLRIGDHIICCNDVFGGTNLLFNKIASQFGLELSLVNGTDINDVKAALKTNTKLIWLESPTNPQLQVLDIAEISKAAHSFSEEIYVAVDNSILSPYFQRPLELGADIVMYAVSKYLNGHSDVVMGALLFNSDEIFTKLKFLQRIVGNIPAPFDCYQVIRGLKTLSLRMQRHSENALAVAKYLETNQNIKNVLHPGLPSHPQHELALRQTYGHSGVISFFINGGKEEVLKMCKAVKLFSVAESFGGVESSIQFPTLMSHQPIPEEQKLALGITDNLVRLSVGIEDADDLIEDLRQALDRGVNHCPKMCPNNSNSNKKFQNNSTKIPVIQKIPIIPKQLQ